MKFRVIITITLLTSLLVGCAPEKEKESRGSLTIGLMPAVDTAPIFLAAENGYFDELNLDVDIQIYTNAQDRQSALQTGQIDGAMTDLVAVAVNVSGGFDIRATTLTDGMFPLLAVPGAADKSEISVGMMEVSVSNFLVDQWLGDDYEIEKIFINAIPARLEAVISGQMDMGLFPEPIASVGEMKGMQKLIFEAVDGFSPDVMVFTGSALDGKSEEVEKFHRAYDKAVEDIQLNEALARDIIIRSIPNLNPALRDMMTLPEYHLARLPDEAYLVKIIEWTRTVVDQDLNVEPADLIDSRFVE